MKTSSRNVRKIHTNCFATLYFVMCVTVGGYCVCVLMYMFTYICMFAYKSMYLDNICIKYTTNKWKK